MATELWVEIVCSGCASRGPGRFTYNSRVPRRELKKEAIGWIFKGDESFCCKGCQEAVSQIKRMSP